MVFLPFIVNSLVDNHYRTAMILFILAGLSDGLDGFLARTLHQQSMLGQYLDPIADKLLLSTMFLVLSILHKIPWKFTVLVFSRDVSILGVGTVLYATACFWCSNVCSVLGIGIPGSPGPPGKNNHAALPAAM